jgi:HAD superfamily hydrolase (TIGR01459 family)
MNITSLSDIAHKYDYYLIDLVGVVYDGKEKFPSAIQAINQLIEQGKKVIFLSNNPRPSTLGRSKLLEMGIYEPFHIFTSGDLARDIFVKNYTDKPLFHVGAERNTDISNGLNLTFVSSLEEADAVLLTLFIEQDQDPDSYDQLMLEIAESNKKVLCANPDKQALYGDEVRFCAGHFAEKIARNNGNVQIIGKPSIEMYTYIEKFIPEIAINKNRVLMIGDTLETDILGAINYGIDSLLVLSGITYFNMMKTRCSLKEYIDLEKIDYMPTYCASELK